MRLKLQTEDKRGRLVFEDDHAEYPAFLIPQDAFFGLVDELFNSFASGATVILETAGSGAGEANATRNLIGRTKKEAVEAALNRPSGLGYGRYELVRLELESRKALIRAHECVFARDKNSEGKSMWYMRGMLKGYFSRIFDDESLICRETRCASSGFKYCEFEIYSDSVKHNQT